VHETMGDDLEALCGRISLIGGEKEGIKILEGEVAADREKGERCLVGRIGDERKVNKEAFKTVLSRIWRIVGTVTFTEVQDNIWLFEFTDIDDKRRVLEGRPWSFDRQILILNDFDGNVPPAQVQFTHSPFWIQVHDMPLIYMNKKVGTKIGESLGVLEDVDVAGDGGGWGRSLRLRVSIDLRNPLERGRMLSLGGKNYWVSFKYERLPLLCFNCGRILHGVKGCMVKKSQRWHEYEGPKAWGIWLRAEEPRRRAGAGSGGDFFQEDGRQSDGAAWRNRGSEKERNDESGNPSQGSRNECERLGAGGNSFLVGNIGDAGINYDFEATSPQLGDSRDELAGRKENETRISKNIEQEKVQVVHENVISGGLSLVYTQKDVHQYHDIEQYTLAEGTSGGQEDSGGCEKLGDKD
jgi:hypothetical protein